MEYKDIVVVTGIGGLFQLVAAKSDGALVRNVTDKSTQFISARKHNVTPLDSIEVYTTGDNVKLEVIFKKMLESEPTIPPVDPKTADNNIIKNYFKSIYPDFNEERVYVSDMKKMLKWYQVLKTNDLLRFDENIEEAQVVEEAEVIDETPDAQVEIASQASEIIVEIQDAVSDFEAKPSEE